MNLLQLFGRLDFISPRQRKKLIWKFCEKTNFTDHNFVVDFYGMKYRGNIKNHIDRFVFFLGAYEKGMLEFIKDELSKSKSKVFVDIGANIGHHSLFAAKFASKVYSFEPYAKVRSLLEQKIADNRLTNITVSDFALGLVDEELEYFEPSDQNTGTGSFVAGFDKNNLGHGLKLTVKNGTQLFDQMGINSIGVMKIDVEGFEANVIEGLLPTIRRDRPIIIIEFLEDTKKVFLQRPQLLKALAEVYDFKKFKNSNKRKYQFLAWNFDSYGDVVFFPK